MTEYFACYQPVVSLATGAPVGWAASLHARREDGRVLGPGALFAGPPSDADLARLDRLGRETALRGAAGWLGDRALYVRLLPAMLGRPDEALAGLDVVAAEAGVRLRQVVVEVPVPPDRAVLAHLARVVTRCRGGGCSVATAVGSAAALDLAAVLAPDLVKLAVPLVTVAAVAAAGAPVLAFGVETAEQERACAEAGATCGQGWRYGRPAPPPPPGATSR